MVFIIFLSNVLTSSLRTVNDMSHSVPVPPESLVHS